jgi:hypothetical protein
VIHARLGKRQENPFGHRPEGAVMVAHFYSDYRSHWIRRLYVGPLACFISMASPRFCSKTATAVSRVNVIFSALPH